MTSIGAEVEVCGRSCRRTLRIAHVSGPEFLLEIAPESSGRILALDSGADGKLD